MDKAEFVKDLIMKHGLVNIQRESSPKDIPRCDIYANIPITLMFISRCLELWEKEHAHGETAYWMRNPLHNSAIYPLRLIQFG